MFSVTLQSPGAILFQLGPLTVRWYGVMVACGFLLAVYFASKLASERQIEKEKLLNCMLVSFLGGIVGARLYFVALNWQAFGKHPEEILAIWLGGLSIHGGILGGLLAGAVFCYFARLSFSSCCDILGTVLPLGQAIGRWGNFFNCEAFGQPVGRNFPIKLYIPSVSRPWIYQAYDYFQPTFLYESLWDLAIFLILYFYLTKKLRSIPGVCFFVYLAAYSLGRLIIEPLRTDSILVCGIAAPLMVSVFSLLISLIGIAILTVKYYQVPKSS